MHRATDSVRLALVVMALGCATTPAPAPPAAAPVTIARADERLQPPEAAVRAARHVELTGRELGTMWTFENPPLEDWRERHDFAPAPAWLDHVRLASVRYGEVCSASFVSPFGLTLTNHHCARQCIEDVAAEGEDLIVDGFAAPTRAAERTCPELFLDQLVHLEDVTARLAAVVPADAAPDAAAAAHNAERERIEAECEAEGQAPDGTPVHACQVVTLYQGGQYQLYRYRRYEPVKLVFAPELQAGYFGGDPDNFTYPRYALDFTFVRAYDASEDSAAHTPHYFAWREEGASEGELVFVTGNPGSTSRLITVAQLMYERVYRHPFIIQLLDGRRATLQLLAAQDEEMAQAVRQDLFEIENALKAYTGQLAGLRDSLLVARKIRWQAGFQERINADAQLRAQYGDVFDRLAALQARKLATSPRLNLANAQFIGAPHAVIGAQLATYVRQLALPEAQRAEAYRGDAAQQVESALRTPSPVDPELARAALHAHVAMAYTWLTPGDPLRDVLIRPGETAADAAGRLLRESRILDERFRAQIIGGGPAALDASDEPFLRLAIIAAPLLAELGEEWQQIQLEERAQRERLGRALFAAFGTRLPPDATFTLRITDGIVSRYPYNGTFAPPHTTYYGLFARSAEFGDAMPWTLPPTIRDARERIRLATPLNFVSTNDITGGNSGSPVIDREAHVVGVAFDGNIEQLPNEFVFSEAVGRTVSVHAAGIIEALRSIYGMPALVAELLGRP